MESEAAGEFALRLLLRRPTIELEIFDVILLDAVIYEVVDAVIYEVVDAVIYEVVDAAIYEVVSL